MGSHFLLQGIFPTQGSNLHFLRWQGDSFPLCHLGSPENCAPYQTCASSFCAQEQLGWMHWTIFSPIRLNTFAVGRDLAFESVSRIFLPAISFTHREVCIYIYGCKEERHTCTHTHTFIILLISDNRALRANIQATPALSLVNFQFCRANPIDWLWI